MNFHALEVNEVYEILKTSENGLEEERAKELLKKYGKNEIAIEKKFSAIKLFIQQFANLLIIILIFAAVLSYVIGVFAHEERIIDSVLILVIVFLNAIFGFVQDYKAEKSIEALKRMSAPKAKVIRNGKLKEISSLNLVPGDLVILEEGDVVPADVRLIETHELLIDESSLTGESEGVEKSTEVLKEDTPIFERSNMAYMNTVVLRGRGKGIVVATGKQTEIGKIAEELKEEEKEETLFQKELNVLGKNIASIIFFLISIIAIIQIIFGTNIIVVILTSAALAVAAIPEGLPAVVTLSLAFGTRKMLRENCLVRRLSTVETLGSVDVICSDKTGTITEGRMRVEKIYYNGKIRDAEENAPLLYLIGLLCNNATEEFGDPTEVALIHIAKQHKISGRGYKRVDEVPFTSERKMMSVVCKRGKEKHVFTKGAPEVVINICNKIYENGKLKKLTKKKKKEILEANEKLAKSGLRVLAFAYGKEVERNMIFVGLQGLRDPPRKEVPDAISLCKSAGIRVMMITGDNKFTAKAIAYDVGIKSEVLEGFEIDKMKDSELSKKLENVSIFARVTPHHKLRILKLLQSKGHVVAMTGDGVNDALAIKKADVGISMGIKGTEVAKQTADMILLDDNFATIVEGIKRGRAIFRNIRNFVNYLLSSNIAEIIVVFVASLFRYLPITAVQLLWINLLTDGLPAIALGLDEPRRDEMKRKPRKLKEGVINKQLRRSILFVGVIISIIVLLLFFLYLPYGLKKARTVVFTAFVFYEILRLLYIRRLDNLPYLSNKYLLFAVFTSILLQLLVLYTPLSIIFGVVALSIFDLLIIVALGIVGFLFLYYLDSLNLYLPRFSMTLR